MEDKRNSILKQFMTKRQKCLVSFLCYYDIDINLLINGIEGEDYRKVAEFSVESIEGGWYHGSGWAFGNTFLVYPNECR